MVKEDAVEPVVEVGSGGAGEPDVTDALEGVGLGVRPAHEGVVGVEGRAVEAHGHRPADAVGVIVPGVPFSRGFNTLENVAKALAEVP